MKFLNVSVQNSFSACDGIFGGGQMGDVSRKKYPAENNIRSVRISKSN